MERGTGMEMFFWNGGFEAMFMIVFLLIIGMFVVMLVKGIGEWGRNNQSPRLTVEAVLIAKRTNVSYHHHHHPNAGDITGSHGFHTSSSASTSYYVTFEVESGDRMEFSVSGRDYGMLVEGDQGRLSFQGTRYLGFEIRKD